MKIGEIVKNSWWIYLKFISKLDEYFTYEVVMLWKLKHGRPLTIKSLKIIIVLANFCQVLNENYNIIIIIKIVNI